MKTTKFLINPHDVSHLVLLKYSINENDPDENGEIKNITLTKAIDLIEENRLNWETWEIWGNVWENGNNHKYDCVAICVKIA